MFFDVRLTKQSESDLSKRSDVSQIPRSRTSFSQDLSLWSRSCFWTVSTPWKMLWSVSRKSQGLGIGYHQSLDQSHSPSSGAGCFSNTSLARPFLVFGYIMILILTWVRHVSVFFPQSRNISTVERMLKDVMQAFWLTRHWFQVGMEDVHSKSLKDVELVSPICKYK